MTKSTIKISQLKRAKRIRAKIHGTANRPRLSVFISLKHVSAQLIDDDKSTTLAYATSINQAINKPLTMTAKAELVASLLAKKAKSLKINQVTLDRGSKKYTGRIAALADKLRQEGIEL